MSIAHLFWRGQDVTGYIGKLLQKERCCKCRRQQQKHTCVVLNWTLCTAQTSSAQVLQTWEQHLGAAFCTRTIQKLFASCRQKCWQDWDPSLQQKHFSCRWKKSPAPNPTEADGRSLMPGLWSRPCTAEKHDLLYLIFKTRWLTYISRPICVMAEIFHMYMTRKKWSPILFSVHRDNFAQKVANMCIQGQFLWVLFCCETAPVHPTLVPICSSRLLCPKITLVLT